ncbi:uncharacterized protein si:ch211-210c8.6 isoform X1 [Hemiscyllium ocellatum]|uniref:uncharacterized protein si:ch211-210c8.6 isoform X1 n=1 Tax=Hemiscyllium ocellatum TaxID=170820 RepID=UPI0029670E86|nr:uncharacterized protein si:ch211-210c8.6 isoform X1 [Hemiscyllium ocellatum]
MGSILVKCAMIDLTIQWVLWAAASILQTEKFYDLAGSGTFIFLTHLSYRWNGTSYHRQKIQSTLVTVWGLRLGLFLFLRVLKEGRDRRFNEVRTSPKLFFVYWTLQGIWIFVTLLPTLILNTRGKDRPLCVRDYTGWIIWVLGFVTETIADQQKWNFKSHPDNVGKFIQTGLWAYSRHPNYFGEILQWTGLFISASSVMKGVDYVSVLSPIFLWYLLTHVSGIPILEKQAMSRWGHDPTYLQYVRNTPALWPFTF